MEFNCKVWISAFDGKVDAASIIRKVHDRFPEAAIQLFDLDRIAGTRHLLLAAYNAEKSFNSKRRISRSLGMELLLFVSGTTQITEALERVGINTETKRVAIIVLAASDDTIASISGMLVETFRGKEDDQLLDRWSDERIASVQRTFGIGMGELRATNRTGEVEGAIQKLAIERSAMLAIAK
jgi:tRNA threonylcarbamoyladenosine modification (KEOPS) complex Cgi121 subunit